MSIIVACEPKFQVSPEAAACATQRSPLVRLLGSSRETECTDRQAFPPLKLFVSGHGLSDQHWLKPSGGDLEGFLHFVGTKDLANYRFDVELPALDQQHEFRKIAQRLHAGVVGGHLSRTRIGPLRRCRTRCKTATSSSSERRREQI